MSENTNTPVVIANMEKNMPVELHSLVMWKEPKQSGILLAAITFAYLLLEKSGFTLIGIIANSGMVFLVATMVAANVSTMLGKTNPISFPKVEISEEVAKDVALSVTKGVNAVLAFAHTSATGTIPIVDFGKYILGLYVLAMVGSRFHVLTLVFLVLFSALTVPKGSQCVYAKYHTEIDAFVAKAQEQINDGVAKIKEKVMSATGAKKQE
ncbi:reticulon [Pycnococcus provasolii]|uniref:Reticulon-like protein n=1 Tax=Pycnococcus provasolii TaxID=41880 RepID=A0A7S2YWY3_9CHLO|mmetsp:Transcript_279/g.653  ORF Transcript_279/g.653 Transcript_279/m.653 type:complete len:210 (+) Transcript_279:42-671(+)